MNTIKRYPPTSQKSLQAWNAADEHILKYLEENKISLERPVIVNDKFGYLTVHLSKYEPQTFIHYSSQKKAVEQNLELNNINLTSVDFLTPLEDKAKKTNHILLKIPKSLDLLNMQLAEMASYCSEESLVLCAFMTKYFSKNILKVAEKYFESVTQSMAWKKSRILVLKKAKPIKFNPTNLLHTSEYNSKVYKQYPGVFSSDHIDYATQFLLEHIEIKYVEKKILDLASGNGVIASEILRKKEDIEMHLIDDSHLAMISAKLNISENATFHYYDDLSLMKKGSFDLVVSNPPSHFEHENNIDISLSLFREVKEILKPGGRFIIVSSKHLNFGKHLEKIFKLKDRKENKKFEILVCEKHLHV